MFVVVGFHIHMAFQTERYAILNRVQTSFGLLDNMVALDLDAAELVADAAAPTAVNQCFEPNVRGKRHTRTGLNRFERSVALVGFRVNCETRAFHRPAQQGCNENRLANQHWESSLPVKQVRNNAGRRAFPKKKPRSDFVSLRGVQAKSNNPRNHFRMAYL